MRRNRRCGCRSNWGSLCGTILISVGAGIFLAHTLPHYFLIILFGGVLIFLGIRYLTRK